MATDKNDRKPGSPASRPAGRRNRRTGKPPRLLDNRIDKVLASQAPGLWPFLAAGHPDLDTTAALLRAFETLPIRGVELGFPFSDPIADGPVIQHAFTHALAGGVRVDAIFEMVASVRGEIDYALLAMVSASIVYRIGVEPFVARAKVAGFDGLIVPDLSLEEAPELSKVAGDVGMHLSMLVAPTTPPDREAHIAQVAGGFLYYVSVQGTTGERSTLAADLQHHVAALRSATALPVLVGFGISTPAHVKRVCRFADGAIVGSAIVHRINDLVDDLARRETIVEDATRFVEALATG